MNPTSHFLTASNSSLMEKPLKHSLPMTSNEPGPIWEAALSSTLHRIDAHGRSAVDGALIYAVDDDVDLTELYTTLLGDVGYRVRAFNNRAQALAAVKNDRHKPDLLITDYLGFAMHVQEFLRACRAAHPCLRILMASGFSQIDAQFSNAGADRFIRKPFTPEEFLDEVRASLAA